MDYRTVINHQFQPHIKYYTNKQLYYNGLVSFCYYWQICTGTISLSAALFVLPNLAIFWAILLLLQ